MQFLSDTARIIFLSPLVVVVALIAAGILNARFRTFFITLALCIYAMSTFYGQTALLLPLEKQYLKSPDLSGVNAVVVLGGGLIESSPDSKLTSTAFKRFVEALEIAKANNLPLIYSGGGQKRAGQSIGEAQAAMQSAQSIAKNLGVNIPILQKPTNSFCLVPENRSDTTSENAFFTAGILHDTGIKNPKIALVTSAAHLKRATQMFETYGFEVVPVGVDFRLDLNKSLAPSLDTLAPNSSYLGNSLNAFYEYLGLIKFYIFGK